MPIPFTGEAVGYVAGRIRQVQDTLERRIGIEPVSCYAAPGQELTELEFVNAVLSEADCDLLLDVNNVYVNSVNFGYDPVEFLRGIDGRRAVYLHVAGHFREAEDLLIDTHGAPVADPVWELLRLTYAHWGVLPTLLERDFNLPPLAELLAEVDQVRALQRGVTPVANGIPDPPVGAISRSRSPGRQVVCEQSGSRSGDRSYSGPHVS
jgi:uncharacterized protein (UPF0276 family)